MSSVKALLTVAALFLAVACGSTTTTDTMTNCTENHACTNGACTCSAGPKKDSSCCNPDSDSSCTKGSSSDCAVFCKVCT